MKGDELDDHMKYKTDFFLVEDSTYWKWLDDFFHMENLYFSIS